MRSGFVILPAFVLMFTAIGFADDQTDRQKLNGTWQSDGGAQSTWTLTSSGDGIHMVSASQGQPVDDFNCNTSGKECSVKHAGHSSKVSMWFNGSKLVELETTGSQTLRRRFNVTGNGDTLEVETTNVTAGGAPDVTHFKRAPVSTAVQASK